MPHPPIDALPTSADMALLQRWTAPLFADPTHLPIRFTLDGQTHQGIPASWPTTTATRALDANLVETIFEARDPHSGLVLRLEATRYRDYPVIEWLAWLTNTGSQPTPVISAVQSLAADLTGTHPVLTHGNGDFNSADGYTPTQTPLPNGVAKTFVPNGGRSCDQAFPYYRLQFQNCGLTLAIGWPGQWAAQFSGTPTGVHLEAGQAHTHFRLQPGEKYRTPRITLLAWTGDETRAINLWRRWYLAHLLPRPAGLPLRPLIACATTDPGDEFTAATAENQIRYIERHAQRGIAFDIWWIDAGWYPCKDPADQTMKWWKTGTWVPDPARFPHGLQAVSGCATEHHADLLLWFEPERIQAGTELFETHRDWLLAAPEADSGNFCLNLANPAALAWTIERVNNLIQQNGVKVYRQDFNFAPLPHWRKNDAPDRQGLTENLHIQGYLQLWDSILARNPGIWIDSCASGGRRNDLETMRRSVPLHYSDYGYGEIPVKQGFHHTLYQWIPYFKDIALDWARPDPVKDLNPVDSYIWHAGLAPMFAPALDMKRDDQDLILAARLLMLFRRAGPFLLHGDYYPLTPFHKDSTQWVVRQFDRPEQNEGCVHALRLPSNADPVFTARLRGLDTTATYRLENGETGVSVLRGGSDLTRDGFRLEQPPRSGALWFYQKVVT